jgi:signal transduction histidine kinase
VFAGLLAATVLATVVASLWVSGLIARPVLALTRFTRDYLQPGPPPLPPSDGPGEIGELGRSFVNLVEALEHSQGTLVQASRLAALGEVTALMAHEVRTPVGILRSSAQMLRNEPALSGESRELLDIVLGETERLNRLVASMLDQTRTRAPQMQRTDLHALMRQAVALLAAQSRERGVTVSLDCAASDAVIDADPEQLVQVLLNLIGNALQILPRDGRVLLRTQLDDGRLSCDVDDDGPGIAPIDRQRLFEPFVHRREGGFGLGLAIVRQIMRAHGGDAVAIDGSALGGARIRLWLPRTHRPQ